MLGPLGVDCSCIGTEDQARLKMALRLDQNIPRTWPLFIKSGYHCTLIIYIERHLVFKSAKACQVAKTSFVDVITFAK